MSTLKVDGIRSNSASSDAITLASDGTCTAKITNNLSNRNLIINGAMQVAQRGTSEASVSSSQYADAPDRWKFAGSSCGTYTVSQSTESPDGFGYSYKLDCTTANTSLSSGSVLELEQRLEGQDLQHFLKGTASAKEFAVSFSVKTNKTGTYVVLLLDGDNSRMCGKTYTVSDSNWNRYTLNFPADTTGAFGNDSNLSLTVKFVLVAGTDFTSGTLATTWAAAANANSRVGQLNFADSTSNDFYITGVQLEVGNHCSDFEHKSYIDELRRCQRYFWKFGLVANAFIFSGIVAGSQDEARVLGQFPVPMRASPSLTYNNLTFDSEVSGSAEAVNAIHAADLSANFGGRIKFGITTTTASNGALGYLYPTDSAGYLQGDSEL
jgi:hypothetical protein